MLDSVARHGVDGLAKRLRERREALGLSQAELGSLLAPPVSDVQISNYEAARRSPTAAALRDLAKALRCTSDFLLGLDASQPEKPQGLMSLQEAFQVANDAGKDYFEHQGRAYRKRKGVWEAV